MKNSVFTAIGRVSGDFFRFGSRAGASIGSRAGAQITVLGKRRRSRCFITAFIFSLQIVAAFHALCSAQSQEHPSSTALDFTLPRPSGSTTSRKSDGSAVALSSAAAVEVETVAFGAGISSATLLGQADSFEALVGTVYFWNRVRVGRPPARIKHMWYHGDKKVGEYAIELTRRRSRLWTRKNVRPGLWRVEVVDAEGRLLTVSTCIVRPPMKPPRPQKTRFGP